MTTHKNNTAGFCGVRCTKSGKYQAYITFQKKRYTLGTYISFAGAKRARLEAEEFLHSGFIKAYQKWRKRAEVDPEWTERNPFLYQVERINSEFQIVTNVDESAF